jgi:hypothetical protein
MKKALIGAVAAGLMLTASGTAVAAWGTPIPDLTSAGVRFSEGEYKLHGPASNHGAFEWKGRLTDGNGGDGHNVYVHVRVEGHDWLKYYGKQRRSVYMHHSNWDGAQRYTSEARIRACRDRGSFHPDNCSHEQAYFQDRD